MTSVVVVSLLAAASAAWLIARAEQRGLEPVFHQAASVDLPEPVTTAADNVASLRTPLGLAEQAPQPVVEATTEPENEPVAVLDPLLAKYADHDLEALSRACAELSDEIDALKSAHFEARIDAGLYEEVAFHGQGPIPSPSTPPPPGTFGRSIINPERRDGPPIEGGVAVWWLYLAENEYPVLYELDRERKWLEHRVSDQR